MGNTNKAKKVQKVRNDVSAILGPTDSVNAWSSLRISSSSSCCSSSQPRRRRRRSVQRERKPAKANFVCTTTKGKVVAYNAHASILAQDLTLKAWRA